ncbi:hypothetical protein [Ulvibacterium marinum]|uniref:hypothetical protein n=1 Tax=Ulvibacterium marinum TaxID=2419782 RepID=UPI001314024B|nr:hypothetical protein [Ulvibacterium marinum]
MKKLISKFSDKLLSKEHLKIVKGGATPYCFCVGSSAYVACPPGYGPGGHVPSGVGGCP